MKVTAHSLEWISFVNTKFPIFSSQLRVVVLFKFFKIKIFDLTQFPSTNNSCTVAAFVKENENENSDEQS